MYCYRITTKEYASKLSGDGARLYGGRWNSEGTSLIYTTETSSLAMLEILVHMRARNAGIHFYLMVIDVPDDLVIKSVKESELPLYWDRNPHQGVTQQFGDQFVYEGKHVVARVPSAVNRLEHNYLMNDRHPNFNKIRLVESVPIDFDRRLLEKH